MIVQIVRGSNAPTNDTIFSAATSIAVITAQQINGIILDRVGARVAGVADGEVAALAPSGLASGGLASGGAPGLQLAQAGPGNAGMLGDLAASLPQLGEGGWFRGIGGFASVNGSSSAPGFTGDTGGFLAGYDRPVTPNIYLGVAGGYLHSDIDEHSTSSGTEESARFNVYGGMLAGPSLFSATAGYAHDWFDTTRGLGGIGIASENHGGNEATAAAQWSLPLPIAGYGGGMATLTPKAGIEYLYLSEDAFSESGAGGFDLSNSGHGTNSLQPYLAAALSQKFVTASGMQLTPELRLGYAHDMFDSRLLTVIAASGAGFPVEGVKPSRDQVTAGIGVVVQATTCLSAYADYDTILHTGNTTEQTIQAGLRLKF
ncbi:MAG TPA: autotransporter outer membrane beta-barrel domain-containing protein [Stellaceae bacterium]|nr:autotransporter outer membrane beta-barrel domain-containing protein [Stellaceae bacterium]